MFLLHLRYSRFVTRAIQEQYDAHERIIIDMTKEQYGAYKIKIIDMMKV